MLIIAKYIFNKIFTDDDDTGTINDNANNNTGKDDDTVNHSYFITDTDNDKAKPVNTGRYYSTLIL